MKKNQSGFSFVELLVVITIMGILFTLAIPAYRNFNEEQTVSQTASMVKDDLHVALNKSAAGVSGHWFGLAFQANTSATSTGFDKYTTFEMTPRDSSDEVVCPPIVLDTAALPCSNALHKKTTEKKYPSGVKLDKIILYDNESSPIDHPSFIDVRFNQSPNNGQLVIGSPSTNKNLRAKIARAELIYKNGSIEKSLVIDGGNICHDTQVDPDLCNDDLTGGPKPSRVFIVER